MPNSDINEMNDIQLLEEFNRLTGNSRTRRFVSHEAGVRAVIAARAAASAVRQVSAAQQEPAPEAAPEPTPAPSRRKRAVKGVVRKTENVKARMANVVIRIKSNGNPYRDGSKSHAHYEKMRGGITVLEYLAKFTEQDQKNARQYLWNAIQDEHVETLGG